VKVTSKASISSDLLFCSYCESWLKKSAFSNGSPICKVCTDVYLQVDSYREPTYSTILNGYVNLFLAIRDRAILDHAQEDFDSYWIWQFSDVWDSLSSLFRSDNSYKISDI
jgi:hypothetical protein